MQNFSQVKNEQQMQRVKKQVLSNKDIQYKTPQMLKWKQQRHAEEPATQSLYTYKHAV